MTGKEAEYIKAATGAARGRPVKEPEASEFNLDRWLEVTAYEFWKAGQLEQWMDMTIDQIDVIMNEKVRRRRDTEDQVRLTAEKAKQQKSEHLYRWVIVKET